MSISGRMKVFISLWAISLVFQLSEGF